MVGLNMNRPSKSFLYPSSEECLATGLIASNADDLATILIGKNFLQPVADFGRYVGIMTNLVEHAIRNIVALIKLKLRSKQVDICRDTCGLEVLLPYLIGQCFFEAPNLVNPLSEVEAKFKRFR